MNKKIILSALDTQITPIIHAVQYDSARVLECSFIDIDVSDVTAARIYAKKPDGTEVYNDCTIDNGYIYAPLSSQTLAVVGTVICQLQLTVGDYLTTFEFVVIVEESLISSSAIESSNEYTALEDALAEVEDVITGLPAKEDKSNKVTIIDENASDTQYPSARAVLSAFQDFGQSLVPLYESFELIANRVTAVNYLSTDYKYPTAKAVYDAIQEALVVDTEEVIP